MKKSMTDDPKTEVDSIRAEVTSRRREEEKKFSKPNDKPETIPLNFIRDCLHANELGDGMLYAAVNRDDFIYEPLSGQWYFWNGVIFERDIEGRAAAAMEKVVSEYDRYLTNLLQGRGNV